MDPSPPFPLTAIAGAPDTSLPAWGHPTGAGYRARSLLCRPILEREAGLFRVVRLLTKRGGPFTAEDAARLQGFLCPLGTILDACRRLAQLG